MKLINEPFYDLTYFPCFTYKPIHIRKIFNYKKMLLKYQKILVVTPFSIDNATFNQYYDVPINVNGSYYRLSFDIDKLLNSIADKNLTKRIFDVPTLMEQIDVDFAINKEILSHVTNQPILVAYIPYATPFYFVIDGNHRTYNMCLKNISEIEGYLLDPHLFIDSIPSEFLQLLTKIHYNIWLIDLHITGQIKKKKLKLCMFAL